MKLRSTLLIACLVVVPLLAMVSHKVPAATRTAIKETLWRPLVGAKPSMPAAFEPPGSIPAAAGGVSKDPAPRSMGESLRPTGEPSPPASPTPPADPIGIPAPVAMPSIDASSRPWERSARSPPTAPSPALLVGSDSSLPIGEATGRESLEARLRALGATRIDWTPAQGGDGLHRCSCRIPAEPTGQLHRVFQAAAADPLAALDNLVGQVTAWSMRAGDGAGGGMAADASMPLRR